MSKLDQFIEKEEPRSRVQAQVSTNVYNRVDQIRKHKKLTWNELVEAMFRRLLSEEK